MKRIFIVTIPVIFIIITTSCLKNIFCVKGDRIMTTETRRISQFNEIENTTSFDILYRKADTLGIIISAEQNILNYIETNVYDNCLEISTSPATICLDYNERPLITVSSPSLSSVLNAGSGAFIGDTLTGETVILKASGSGDITINMAAGENIDITVSGAGNIELEMAYCGNYECLITGSGDASVNGACVDAHFKISGSGNIYASDLVAVNSSVIISGSGNVFTTTTEYLNALISGSGNVFVEGNPEIDQSVTGSGRIINYK
jgi:hypothetical protein